jgi:hypothetical protein
MISLVIPSGHVQRFRPASIGQWVRLWVSRRNHARQNYFDHTGSHRQFRMYKERGVVTAESEMSDSKTGLDMKPSTWLSSRVCAVVVMSVLAGSSIAQAEPITLNYRLLPGSTITPVIGATPIGPAEKLRGSFNWLPSEPTCCFFEATALSFYSPSFSITLNQTALNNSESIVFPDSPTTYFSEVVDLGGFDIDVGGVSSSVPGSYLGSPGAPTFVSYPFAQLSPLGGGTFRAKLNFSAVLVPEPSAWILSSIGLTAPFFLRAVYKSNTSKRRWISRSSN